MQQNDTQPQFDDVDEFAHVFDSTLPEDEWKIRLPRELGLEARERARHDGITLTELTRRALLSDDSDGCSDAVGIGRMPKNSDGRKQLGDEWKIKLPYGAGQGQAGRHFIKLARAQSHNGVSQNTQPG